MATDAPFRFLDLPAEMRNRIYRDVLVDSDRENPIVITPFGYARHALLQACGQIYAEAFQIYYLENTFSSPLLNLNALSAMDFHAQINSLKTSQFLREQDTVTHIITLTFDKAINQRTGMPEVWDNLWTWLKYVHEGDDFRCNFPMATGDGGRAETLKKLLDGMFRDVVELRTMSWERVKRIFEEMREEIVRADRRRGGSFWGFSAGRGSFVENDGDDDGDYEDEDVYDGNDYTNEYGTMYGDDSVFLGDS